MTTHPAAVERKQWRVVAKSGDRGITAFVDEQNEQMARAAFAQMFPRAVIVSCALEPVDPCAQYQKREAR